MGKILAFFPEHVSDKKKIHKIHTSPKRDDEHPHPLHFRVMHPPRGKDMITGQYWLGWTTVIKFYLNKQHHEINKLYSDDFFIALYFKSHHEELKIWINLVNFIWFLVDILVK